MSVNVHRTEQTERTHPLRILFCTLLPLILTFFVILHIFSRNASPSPASAETHIAAYSEDALFDSSIAENGAYALLFREADTRATLAVYDAEGVLRFRHRSLTVYLNTCTLSPDGTLVAVTSLGTQQLDVTACLHLFATDTGSELVSWELDGLPYACDFHSSDTLRVCTDNGEYYYSTDGTLLSVPSNQ